MVKKKDKNLRQKDDVEIPKLPKRKVKLPILPLDLETNPRVKKFIRSRLDCVLQNKVDEFVSEVMNKHLLEWKRIVQQTIDSKINKSLKAIEQNGGE